MVTLERKRDEFAQLITTAISSQSIDFQKIREKLSEIEQYKDEIQYSVVLEELGDLIKSIQTGADRTSELVKSIRHIVRNDQSKYIETDLNQLMDSTLLLLENKLKRNVEVIRNYHDLPLIECNPSEISHVFFNLINNAIHAMDGKGVIEIRTNHELNDKKVYISITDSGHSMETPTGEEVFKPFYVSRRIPEGTGLGLSTSKATINEHHGQIYFESDGSTTCFFIELPVHQPIVSDREEKVVRSGFSYQTLVL
jgi:signal transduction histidine kinase